MENVNKAQVHWSDRARKSGETWQQAEKEQVMFSEAMSTVSNEMADEIVCELRGVARIFF